MKTRVEPEETRTRLVWRRPREWRRHPLGNGPYWVEEELLLVQGLQQLAQLSFDEPLDAQERARFEHALMTQASLVAADDRGLG